MSSYTRMKMLARNKMLSRGDLEDARSFQVINERQYQEIRGMLGKPKRHRVIKTYMRRPWRIW